MKIFTFIVFLFFSQIILSQEAIFHEDFNKKIENNQIIKRVFSINSTKKLSVVSLKINGYDAISNNILPVIVIKINNKKIFEGALSDFTYGKNHRYGEIEFNITKFIKSGSNEFSIEYAGLSAGSFNYIKSISISTKYSGIFFKQLEDFNYNQALYTNYLRKTLTIESTVIATENYQTITKGMRGTYYGEATFNSNFCCIKWSKNLNSDVNCPNSYPSKYKSYAFYVPFVNIKIEKLKTFGDNQPPEITSFVSNTTTVDNKSIIISGKVADKNGVYAIYINKIKTIIDENGFYKLEIPLDVGSNRVIISACDNFGNFRIKQLFIKREISIYDIAPQISILYPQKKEVSVFFNSIKIQGKVSDDDAVSYVQIEKIIKFTKYISVLIIYFRWI